MKRTVILEVEVAETSPKGLRVNVAAVSLLELHAWTGRNL